MNLLIETCTASCEPYKQLILAKVPSIIGGSDWSLNCPEPVRNWPKPSLIGEIHSETASIADRLEG